MGTSFNVMPAQLSPERQARINAGADRLEDELREPREMVGLFSQLTDEQKERALSYDGPINCGRPKRC